MRRVAKWLEKKASAFMNDLQRGEPETPTIVCSECEKRVLLWDDMERHFASPETQQYVRELQEQSAVVLDNESKQRALVGDVISTVTLAGQISREFQASDHGIDMEIEFKSDEGEGSGQKVYLQLKLEDSYVRERRRDGAEVFTIKHESYPQYWIAQEFPVLLVIRNSKGESSWMEIRDWLKRESANGTKPVKQIAFVGERFDVMSVRAWRDRALGQGSA